MSGIEVFHERFEYLTELQLHSAAVALAGESPASAGCPIGTVVIPGDGAVTKPSEARM